tara:strand:- start:51 stop:1781 length:1731 start_codon:yes stop_codon:yes gene_type:complete
MGSYKDILEAVTRKPGDVWKTKNNKFRGMNQSGNMQSFPEPDQAKSYVATKDKEDDEPKKKLKKKSKSIKSSGEVLDTIPKQDMGKVRAGYNNPTTLGGVKQASPKDQISNRINEIEDKETKKTAQEVQKSMDQFMEAETDEEKEEILRGLAENNLIQINTEDPNSSDKKIYFDTVLTGLDRKTLGNGNVTTKEMWRIIHEKKIAAPLRGSSQEKALADMSGKHNESGMVLLLCPKDGAHYKENSELHEKNSSNFGNLGGSIKAADQRNIDMSNEIKTTIPKGSKISDASNTGGLENAELAEQFNIVPKDDPTDLIVFYTPPNPDPSVKVPTVQEYEKEYEKRTGKSKKFKDMSKEERRERDELVHKKHGGMRKVSAKSYRDPSNITMKNSGAREAGSAYLGDKNVDSQLQETLQKPEYNYKEEGLTKEERDDRKKNLKREYMDTMQSKMEELASSDEGQKQLLKMWQDVHGCGNDVYTSISNKTTGEATLHPPDYYCKPKLPFKIGRNDTSITVDLEETGSDSVKLDLKTQSDSSPVLLFVRKSKKSKEEEKKEPEDITNQYESLEGTISRMKHV